MMQYIDCYRQFLSYVALINNKARRQSNVILNCLGVFLPAVKLSKCKNMYKIFLVLLFFSAILQAGVTLTCYECISGPECGDPFNSAYNEPVECPSSSKACIKRQYQEVISGILYVERLCEDESWSCNDFLDVNNNLPGVFSHVKCYDCSEDFCNSLTDYGEPITTIEPVSATSSNIISSTSTLGETTTKNYESSTVPTTTPWYYSTSTPRNTPGENTTWNYWQSTTTSRPSKTTWKYDRNSTTSRWPIRTTTRTTRKYYSRPSPAPIATTIAPPNNNVDKPLTIINILYGTFNFQNLNIMPNNVSFINA